MQAGITTPGTADSFLETTAVVNVEVTRINKAVFIFDKMNIEGELIAKDDLLKKKPTKNNGRW